MQRHLRFICTFIFIVILFVLSGPLSEPAHAQKPRLVKDYSFVLEIPGIQALESSLTHLYVLSDVEGLAVFRTHPDTLQWLYTTPGMSQRGHRMNADIRFAYLYGNNQRFSVIEPTSVVGVYSATNLPNRVEGVHRLGSDLYMALDGRGLGRLSITSPSAFDSTVVYPVQDQFDGTLPLDLTGNSETLIASADDGSVMRFRRENQRLALDSQFTVEEPLQYIYWEEGILFGATSEGQILLLTGNQQRTMIGSIGEEVEKIRPWNNWLIIRGESGRLWTSYRDGKPTLWKDNRDAGNYFTINKGQFWINEYNKVARIKQIDPLAESRQDTLGLFVDITSLELRDIKSYTTPLPHPVLVPIQLEEEYPVEAIQYTYESATIEDAYLRKQGFYWQPGSDDTGRHRVKIIATSSSGASDSTTFTINVKSFNAPPRFSPMRSVTIPAGETYTMPINAFDPDGTFPDLIRYLGMNLPDGGQINQQTGQFKWTPTPQQTGKHTFKVIATDQYGAATSEKISLEVIPKPSYDQ